jgi:hypothetical protein
MYDYTTKGAANGFTHEVAPAYAGTKKGYSVSAIHASTNIIGDHDDSLTNLYFVDSTLTTGTYAKSFITATQFMSDINYIEGTNLVFGVSWTAPRNAEIHDPVGTTNGGTFILTKTSVIGSGNIF